ncbi:GNAT family N-acetyltransferase [Dactylosporangium sp. AC04546]|uniref:GNAT family N-acetyltransferase n=1 Tax=Dactylosporangium sp. AC04546 TaxID=2862460 RepID=UPI001EDFD36F|nr:GNAT family N-acetyltransferase [Dactylosporangium sp. AC04546]WVK87589.1 GNAT family N-acetyltransferase [Dactylosporangium sp. AC04546]
MTTPDITLATPADRPSVVATFVAAFESDPAIRYFLPSPDTYESEAATMAAALFDPRAARGTVWLANAGAAVAMWDAPTRAARHTPAAPTDDAWGRYQSTVHAALPDFPHWYLGVLATHPTSRGQRLGRAVMAAGLSRADADGVPSYLETSNPANVEVYRSVGFEVQHHLLVDALPVWIMSRPPA